MQGRARFCLGIALSLLAPRGHRRRTVQSERALGLNPTEHRMSWRDYLDVCAGILQVTPPVRRWSDFDCQGNSCESRAPGGEIDPTEALVLSLVPEARPKPRG